MKNLKSNLLILLIIFAFIMTSCTTTRVANLTKEENETIELFTTKIPDRKYVEICYIETSGGVFHTPQQLLNGLKRKAEEIKADAVVNIKYDFQAWYPIVSGIAIRYID